MFIKLNDLTINCDHIIYAKHHDNGMTTLHLVEGNKLDMETAEANELFGMLGRQATPTTFRRQQDEAN